MLDVVAALRAVRDPPKAVGMEAYMRGQFAFLGVSAPQRRAATTPLFRAFRPESPWELIKVAQMLWHMREREFQYVGVDLLGRYRKILRPDELEPLLVLLQEKPWWDSVDGLAGVVGSVVRRYRDKGQSVMDEAINSESFWIRRMAILHQLGWRGDTDANRLYSYAKQLGAEKELFIQKAIGWALRDFARHDPQAVCRFLSRAESSLSVLSVREARRHL